MHTVDGYRIDTYGDSFADVYDDWYPADPDCTEMLASLSGGHAILDLGAGTGAIASALADCGHAVVAIDASERMLDRARARSADDARGARSHLVRADMSHMPLGDHAEFGLVFVSYNTLFNLTDVQAQDRCLHEAIARLRPDGALAMEAFVPAIDARRDDVSISQMTTDRVVLTASKHDPANQRVEGQHIEIGAAGVRLRPWSIRYASPTELDERMSALGCDLAARYSSWRRDPFDGSCSRHVSIWRPRPGS